MTLALRLPDTRRPERRYAASVVLEEFLGLRCRCVFEARDDVLMSLESAPESGALRMADVLLASCETDWLRPASCPREPPPRWHVSADLPELDAPPLPVLFGRKTEQGGWLRIRPGLVELGVDVLGTAFFMLTRYEELARPARDGHGRFPATASLAWRAGLLGRPIVDEHVDLLWACLRRVWPRLRRRAHRYRAVLTHDVDVPLLAQRRTGRQIARSLAGDVVRRRSPNLAARRARAHLDVRRGRIDRDPADTFDLIQDLSERHGTRSAFYFLAGGAHPHDGAYRLSDPAIRALLTRIHRRGHEIGLHLSYDSYRDARRAAEEFRSLARAAAEAGVEQPEWGVRQHFLRWENPVTWRNAERTGLAYDTTVAFADRPGFRCGVCRPYPAFDLIERRALRIRERPLIVMDATLLDHLRLSPDRALDAVARFSHQCRRHRGELVLLWHNTYLLTARQRALYRDVVAAVTA